MKTAKLINEISSIGDGVTSAVFEKLRLRPSQILLHHQMGER